MEIGGVRDIDLFIKEEKCFGVDGSTWGRELSWADAIRSEQSDKQMSEWSFLMSI